MKVLLTTTSFQDTPGAHHALLERSGFDVVRARGPLSEAQMLDLLGQHGGFDAFLNGDDRISVRVIDAAGPRLRVIAKYGIGLDSIDVAHATAKRIPVLFTPGVNHTTVAEHMPPSHRQYQQWTPERFLRWATKIGPQTAQLAEKILATRIHPQQAYRTLLGILRLGKSYGDQRLEKACARALVIGAVSFRSVDSILKNGLDNTAPAEENAPATPVAHDNIRGPLYYHATVQ